MNEFILYQHKLEYSELLKKSDISNSISTFLWCYLLPSLSSRYGVRDLFPSFLGMFPVVDMTYLAENVKKR